jgi:peptide/nickel transport system substrate-binding protein
MRAALRVGVVGLALLGAGAAAAQEPKYGGTMRIYQRDNPGVSIHEEATYSTNMPFMAVFNNLVLFDQHKQQNTVDTIQPELATEWAWGADNRSLSFKLRTGVKWHDGKPFTAKDVVCTFDKLRGKAEDGFRKNPRQGWYFNVTDVVAEGDYAVTFKLGRPQPSLLSMLASGYTPIYPCHVPSAKMRTAPIGTGPFKFVEFRQNEVIKLAKNPDYWRKGRPYLDALEFPIVTNRSTAILGFVAGKFDMTFPTEVTAALVRDVMAQAPKSVCELAPMNVATNLLINREAKPFDNPDVRRAMALALDHQELIKILSEGNSSEGGTMLPPPDGIWGMPKAMMQTMVGYSPDVAKSRAEGRAIMEKLGYGPGKMLKAKVSTRNLAVYRDPAVVVIDHLKQVHIDAELDVVETTTWFAKMARKDYQIGVNLTGNAIDDPDQSFYENYACGSERNYTDYCNKPLQALFDQQSQETDLAKRRELVWKIDMELQNDIARPIIFHGKQATCWAPYVHGFRPMVNSSYNGYRFEDLWMDK